MTKSSVPSWISLSLIPRKHTGLIQQGSNARRILFVGSRIFAKARSEAKKPARRIGPLLAVDIEQWTFVTKAEFEDPDMIAEIPFINWLANKRHERNLRIQDQRQRRLR